MVAHFTMRIYGVNRVFRFVESIWLPLYIIDVCNYYTYHTALTLVALIPLHIKDT